MSGNSRLSAELVEIDAEVAKIDELIGTLKLKRRKLLEKKQQIEKTLELRSSTATENGECFEGETFEWSAKARKALTDVFHIANYRPLQLSTINAVLSGEDTLLVMSTGGGKSLCYQLPAVIGEGVALVVSPLISLIEDQLMSLRKWGVDAGALNQATIKEETTRIQNALTDRKSTLKMLYVTPEKLAKSKRFMAKLEKCHEMKLLRLIAIDEVHCCSQWGHDFRPDYKFLNVLKRQFRGVPLLGLTATATASVLDDVKTILGISGALVFRAGFNRENLFYEVRAKPSSTEEHIDDMASLISRRFPDQSGIVYCFSRKESEDVAAALRNRNIRAAHYHAQMESDQRTKVHQRWMEGKYKIIVATVAFGMGIDKPDVRFVIHHSLAKSMENYYQESGRAGRDGLPAVCILYFRLADVFRQSTMVATERTGVEHLYGMLAYSMELTRCRRALLAEHFGETWEQSWCRDQCDICGNGGGGAREVDATEHWRAMIGVIEEASTSNKKDGQGKLTGAKVIDLCGKKLPKKVKVRPSKELLERTLATLLLEGYLREDFHFTPYAIISYVVAGPKHALFANDQTHRVFVTVPAAESDAADDPPSAKKRLVEGVVDLSD